MEKRNQLDAFEEFILDEVNEHKMYPSGRVWDNIRTEVHGNRSWPALTIIALTVLVALTVSTFIVTQKSEPIALTNNILKMHVISLKHVWLKISLLINLLIYAVLFFKL